MWKLDKSGYFAENKETGQYMRIELGKDNIVRVKKKYTTVATFKDFKDAEKYLAEFVKSRLVDQ